MKTTVTVVTVVFYVNAVTPVIRNKKKTIPSYSGAMIGQVIVVYILVVAIRLVVICLLYPILKRTGYGINWKTALVMLWGGLRGAVGLALALGEKTTEALSQK